MRAWSGAPGADQGAADGDIMGPTVDGAGGGGGAAGAGGGGGGGGAVAMATPPLKNGRALREAGYLIAVGSRTRRRVGRGVAAVSRRHRAVLCALCSLTLLLLAATITLTVLYVRALRLRPRPLCTSAQCLRSATNLMLSMDPTADPCEDFYQFSCGRWSLHHPQPDALQSYDWFRDQQLRVHAMVRDLLERNETVAAEEPVQLARDMFAACLDTETLDKLGMKPVLHVLESVGLPPYPTYVNLTTGFDYSAYRFDWVDTVIKIKTQMGMDVLIGFDLFTDPTNSSVYRLVMGSPETTNPFPSVLRERKRHSQRKRWKYKASPLSLINRMLNFNDDHRFETDDDSSGKDEDDIAHTYKVLYAELMKLVVIESGQVKDTSLTETELDANIFLAANEFYSINDDMYELESANDTDSGEDEDLYLSIPEYTAQELQAQSDAVLAANNASAEPVWARYLLGVFQDTDVTLDLDTDRVLVSEPDLKYLALMAAYVARTPPAAIELYIWVKVVEVLAPHTTTEVRLLLQRAASGGGGGGGAAGGGGGVDAGSPPRRALCTGVTHDLLGLVVAHELADTHFLNDTKPKILEMINDMKNALAELVGRAGWMDDATKLASYRKITSMRALVGFPEWLLEPGALRRRLAGVRVRRDAHVDNMLSVVRDNVRRGLRALRLGNNGTWPMDPTEVNAYHTFQDNTITVPMVMLQYPFYDLGLDSLNYGALGSILGHEITHGFDNFGRQFDPSGNLVPWWSNGTVRAFLNLTRCFVDQYDAYQLTEIGEHVDGRRTLGENIADNGGVREALAALRARLARRDSGASAAPEPALPGPGLQHLTQEQLFFLAYGNLWCGSWRAAALRGEAADEHAPTRLRARAALANEPAFARAWRCRPGADMNPPQHSRCRIY